jgi:hypothetical protein
MNQVEVTREVEREIVDRLKKEYVLVPRVKAAFYAGIAVALIGASGGLSYGVVRSVVHGSAAYAATKEVKVLKEDAAKTVQEMTDAASNMANVSQSLVTAIERNQQESEELLARLRQGTAGVVLGGSSSLLSTEEMVLGREIKVLEVPVEVGEGQSVLLAGQLAIDVDTDRANTTMWLARGGRRITPIMSSFPHKHVYVHTQLFVDRPETPGPVTYEVWAAKADGAGIATAKRGFLQVVALN